MQIVTVRLRPAGASPVDGRGAASVEGIVERADGTCSPFRGWMELLDHLESVLEDETPAA